MRTLPVSSVALAAALIAAPLAAQDFSQRRGHIEFDAQDGVPITELTVNGVPVRFALDPLMGANLAINPLTAETLMLQGIEDSEVDAGIDEVTVPGRLTRVSVRWDGRIRRTYGALVGRTHFTRGSEQRYEVAGGFEALPARKVTVHLNRNLEGPFETISFQRRARQPQPGFPVSLSGVDMRLNVHFANRQTWLDRRAAQMMVDEGKVEPAGEIERIPVWFGLQLPVQDVASSETLSVNGLPLTSLQVRTDEPLVRETDDQAGIVVSRLKADQRAPVILIGTDALSHCASMTYQQNTRRLSLRCQVRN